MVNTTASDHYAAWSLDTFERRIEPLLRQAQADLPGGIDRSAWLSTCAAGSEPEVRHRLFPGAFFLLWVEALAGPDASQGLEPIAAAIECLHNASLVHDDILDQHSIRRRQPTLLASHGPSVALLGGDGLFARALCLIGQAGAPAGARLAGCAERLGRATEAMIAGQLLDEPAHWRGVAPADHEQHWLVVCRGKLALGHAGASLAAYWTGAADEQAVDAMVGEHSVISQIINDFGDVHGWAGYHALSPDLRAVGEESGRKPTLPVIWARQDPGRTPAQLLERAAGELDRRKQAALKTLQAMALDPSRRGPLTDFFVRPSLPAGGRLAL